jgi:hypothetical protein
MGAPRGTRPPNAGKGRKPGSRNKFSSALKDEILGALDDVGGRAYFVRMAEKQPVAFMSLLGRVLPLQVTGDATAPLQIQIVRFGDPPAE